MPPLDAETISSLLSELDGGALTDELAAQGSVLMFYEPVGGPRYDVSIRTSGNTLSMTFRPSPGPSTPRPRAAQQSLEPVPAIPEPIQQSSAETSAKPQIAALLEAAVNMGCEDVILSTSSPARGRIDGRMQVLTESLMSQEDIDDLVRSCAQTDPSAMMAETGSADFALSIESHKHTLRFRVNVFRHQGGVTVVLRPIRTRVPTLSELGLPEDFKSLVAHPHGLVLFTGPAGAGKSTTLVSLVEHVNQIAQRHVITLEDPIEYLYQPGQCLIHQRELGRHVDSFSGGLRSALRESPDIIVVGEMRDTATISAALIAAETGHLVLSTLHAGTTTMAVERVIGAFAPHEQNQIRMQLAVVLRGIVAQVLLPGIAPHGRVVAYEKLVVNHAAATKIREDRCHQLTTVLQAGRGDGMVPFAASLAERVSRGLIRAETALAACPDPEQLRNMIRR